MESVKWLLSRFGKLDEAVNNLKVVVKETDEGLQLSLDPLWVCQFVKTVQALQSRMRYNRRKLKRPRKARKLKK